MKKLTALLLFSFLAAASVRATVIWQETFNYSNGPVSITSTNGTGSTTISNWITHSGNLDCFVNTRRLEVCSSTTYLGLQITRSGDVHRLLATTPGSSLTNAQQVLYASFIVNFTNLPVGAGTYFGHFYVNSTTFPGRVWAQTNGTMLPNTFRLGISSGSTISRVYPVDLALNTDYQVVMGYCPVTGDPGGLADDSTTLWINPIASSSYASVSADSFSPGTSIANSFGFRQASSFGAFLTVSNLVIANTFAEAATNALSTNAVTPKIIVQPVGTTNFVGSSIALYAIANGQGLGDLTYQWQTNGVNISNPAGNTNVLIIDGGSAQTNDSANYTLAVTTPFGLSTTSSVAKVLVSLAKVPPTFLTQPVSQTIYKGQNMVLTTTVVSPGNVAFTWYSNNVIVTAGQTDAGQMSTYEIDNVITNNSATYKVAVTNDYAGAPTNGVISSNAVVTVLNAPAVTIAYLRTLVDPNNNYQALNSTLPYQVTGTVTTYTNLTSGNTSSYYLQDATAGINIFATFGSTFRPAEGDTVTFVGVTSSFSSGLELYADTTTRPYTSYVDTGAGSLPSPLIIPFNITNSVGYPYMNTNIAGRLVELTNVFFGANAGTAISSGFMTVTNNLGQQINLWFSAQDADTVGQTLPVFASSVTGVMFGSMNPSAPIGGVANPNFAVAVTKFSDIVVLVSPIPLNISVSNGTNFIFNWSDPSFSLQSATNLLGPWTTIPGAADGFTTNATPDNPTVFFRLTHP